MYTKTAMMFVKGGSKVKCNKHWFSPKANLWELKGFRNYKWLLKVLKMPEEVQCQYKTSLGQLTTMPLQNRKKTILTLLH